MADATSLPGAGDERPSCQTCRHETTCQLRRMAPPVVLDFAMARPPVFATACNAQFYQPRPRPPGPAQRFFGDEAEPPDPDSLSLDVPVDERGLPR